MSDSLNIYPSFTVQDLNEIDANLKRHQASLNYTERVLKGQDQAFANFKSKQYNPVVYDQPAPPEIGQKKASQYMMVEQKFRQNLRELEAREFAETTQPVLDKANKFILQEQARLTGHSDLLLDGKLSDIDISRLSMWENYQNVIQSKRLEFMQSTPPDQIDDKVHDYLSSTTSPVVADALMGRVELETGKPTLLKHGDIWVSDEAEIIARWLDTPYGIASRPEEITRLVGTGKPEKIAEKEELTTLDTERVPKVGPIPSTAVSTINQVTELSKEQQIAKKKEAVLMAEIGMGLLTIPAAATGGVVAGAVAAFDIASGIPPVFTGKDELQGLVVGRENADELVWWERALYGIGGLSGLIELRAAVKPRGRLQQQTLQTFEDIFGSKQAQDIISNGRTSTTIALKTIFEDHVDEWNKLQKIRETAYADGKLVPSADHIELMDMMREIENGLSRSNDELLTQYTRANNPLNGLAQKVAMGDMQGLRDLHKTVVDAANNPDAPVKITEDIDPNMVLYDFRPFETVRSFPGEIVKDMNDIKKTVQEAEDIDDLL